MYYIKLKVVQHKLVLEHSLTWINYPFQMWLILNTFTILNLLKHTGVDEHVHT